MKIEFLQELRDFGIGFERCHHLLSVKIEGVGDEVEVVIEAVGRCDEIARRDVGSIGHGIK